MDLGYRRITHAQEWVEKVARNDDIYIVGKRKYLHQYLRRLQVRSANVEPIV